MRAQGRPVSASISAKFGSDLVGRLLQFVLFAVAARILSPSDFGGYAFALAVGVVLGQLSDAGLQLTLLRNLSTSHDRDEGARALGTALVGRMLVSLPAIAVGLVLVAFVDLPSASRVAVAVIVVAQIVGAYSDLFAQVLRAGGRLDLEAGVTLGARTALAVTGCLALLAGSGLSGLALVYVGIGLAWPVAMAAVARRFQDIGRPASLAVVGTALRRALPLGLGIGVSLLMFRVDVPILESFQGPATVGLYSTAYRLFEASLLIPVAVMAAAFPELARAMGDRVRFRAAGLRWAAILAGLGVATAVAGWILGPTVLRLAFGPDYTDAGPLLQVLVLAIPPMFVNALLSQELFARGLPWRSTVAFAVGLAVNVVINLWLIPTMGATGAAWATVAAESALFLGLAAAGLTAGRSHP